MEMSEDDADELVEFWTLLDEDRGLLASKRGATALGYALLLKYYSRQGSFPRSRAELPEAVQVNASKGKVALVSVSAGIFGSGWLGWIVDPIHS